MNNLNNFKKIILQYQEIKLNQNLIKIKLIYANRNQNNLII